MDEQVTLTAYSDQIRDLIQNNRNDEAIAICKHILRYYPKYVEVYSHLGQALLEKGQREDAKDVFRRVLSADPENIIAYVGLAILLEQEQLIAEAVWHMERAYELSPGNPELYQELQRLYHELDGRPRARLKLTSGALARLHMQEGLFPQAIQAWNAIVAADEKRFDARVALAQTLWQAGQMRPAAETAQALLQVLPYCLKANLILGAVWKEIGLAESAQYLQRAQELDPTNRVAKHIFGARSPLPLAEPRVPRFVESIAAAAPVEPAVTEPVVEETPFAPAPADTTVVQPPLRETTPPPWLVADQETPHPEAVAEIAVESPPTESQPEAAGELEWLARLREQSETPAPTIATEEALPSESREAQAVQVAAPQAPKEATVPEEAALPAWPVEIAPAEQAVAPSPPTEAAPTREQLTPFEEAPAPTREEELSPWLTQPTSPAEPTRTTVVEGAEELPPWLTQPTSPAEPTHTAVVEGAEKVPLQETKPAPVPGAPVEETRPSKPRRTPARKHKLSVRGESHLILARTFRDANQITEALREYDYVVQKAPRLIKEVIADLEVLARRPGVPLEVHRILGDAYMRANRLAEALAEYRLVLERVSSR